MTSCDHSNLLLLSERKSRLRCRNCHLTIAEDELGDGYCPECFDANGKKQYDFEPVQEPGEGKTIYRCEDCGIRVEVD